MEDTGPITGASVGAPDGVTGGSSGARTGAPPAGWQRVADVVAATHQRQARQYVQRHFGDEERIYVPRPAGGAAELWVSPEVVRLLIGHYGSPERAPEHSPVPPPESPVSVPVYTPEATTEAAAAPDRPSEIAPEQAPDTMRLVREVYETALGEARRATEMAVERAALSEQRSATLEARVAELERRADVLETQLRRSRDEADRWRSRAAEVLGAWHTWRRAVDQTSRWRLARRRLPAEPPEFTSGPALAPPAE